MSLDLADIMQQLAETRPIFHSEADFQHSLARQIRMLDPTAEISLETRPVCGVPLDLLVDQDNKRIAVELKYLCARFHGTVGSELYDLPSQSAQDISRHDVVKDIVRVEQVVAEGFASQGWVIALTNDGNYWRPPRGADPIDLAVRLHEGRTLSGPLAWSERADTGTTNRRDEPLVLRHTYQCIWRRYATVGDSQGRHHEFRYLALEVDAAPRVVARLGEPDHAAPPALVDPSPVVRRAAPSRSTSARDEILEAARSLAARTPDRTFAVADVVRELQSRGTQHAESTIRTLVTSRLCANAPDHHTIVFRDLLRVSYGRYRLLVP